MHRLRLGYNRKNDYYNPSDHTRTQVQQVDLIFFQSTIQALSLSQIFFSQYSLLRLNWILSGLIKAAQALK